MEAEIDDERLILKGAPVPPSDNQLYLNVNWGKGRSSRVKAPSYRQFIREFEMKTMPLRNLARGWASNITPTSQLSLQIVGHFHLERMFCKNGHVKRFDIQNRVKAVCDQLADFLQIDDRLFFEFSISKIACPASQPERLDIYLEML